MKKLLFILIAITFTNVIAQDVDNYIELLKSDVKADKVQIITEVMNFTDEQGDKFWPIYREFEFELDKLSDTRIANIKDFAANYDSLTDEKASGLMKTAFGFQEDRLDLNESYYSKFADALGPIIAAKYMQLEYEIQLIIDLTVNSNLPLAKKPGE